MLQIVISKTVAALRSRKGVSSLEYAILAIAVVGAVAAAATTLSSDISTAFSSVATSLTAATTKAGG